MRGISWVAEDLLAFQEDYGKDVGDELTDYTASLWRVQQ
jgi:hypothetical protein